MKKNIVKILFGIRIILWLIALGATYYWISFSFKIYSTGIVDESQYAIAFRPIFYRGLIISVVAVCISLIIRTISDKVKNKKTEE